MGVFGQMFPEKKIVDVSSEAGDGQPHWQLGTIDLETGVVQVHRVAAPADGQAEPDGSPVSE